MRRLIAALGLLLLATPVFAQATDQITYYHTDAIGSVRMITDATGAVVQRHDYLPFGEEWLPPAGSTEKRLFAGKERDAESGFVYFGGRYYAGGSNTAPGTGRFTTVDPILDADTALLSPQHWNRYAYVANNPLRYTDPDGRCFEDLCFFEAMMAAAALNATVQTTTYLRSPQGQEQIRAIVTGTTQLVTTAVGRLQEWMQSTDSQKLLPERAGPTGHISPGEIIDKTPDQIDKRARELGLDPRGPDPAHGRGSYVDPITGEQRILSHPNDPRGPHGHVNDPNGNRVGPNGEVVGRRSPKAHLPIKPEEEDREP